MTTQDVQTLLYPRRRTFITRVYIQRRRPRLPTRVCFYLELIALVTTGKSQRSAALGNVDIATTFTRGRHTQYSSSVAVADVVTYDSEINDQIPTD